MNEENKDSVTVEVDTTNGHDKKDYETKTEKETTTVEVDADSGDVTISESNGE